MNHFHPSKFSTSVINAFAVLLIAAVLFAFIFLVLCSLGGCSTVKHEASFKESAKVGLFPPLPWETVLPPEVYPQNTPEPFSPEPLYTLDFSAPVSAPQPPVAITNFDVSMLPSVVLTETNQFFCHSWAPSLPWYWTSICDTNSHMSYPNSGNGYIDEDAVAIAYFPDYGTTNYVPWGGNQ